MDPALTLPLSPWERGLCSDSGEILGDSLESLQEIRANQQDIPESLQEIRANQGEIPKSLQEIRANPQGFSRSALLQRFSGNAGFLSQVLGVKRTVGLQELTGGLQACSEPARVYWLISAT